MTPSLRHLSSGADMRSSLRNRLLATGLGLAMVAALASPAAARLSIIPGVRPTPRPTSSQVAPTPRSTATPAGGSGVRACQAQIASESALLLGDLRSALGTCLTRGVRCLVTENGSSACCEEAALQCQTELNTIAAATRRFREAVRDGACGALPLATLLAPDGLGFETGACGSLTPPIAVTDPASFADCLQLLMTRDVLHQVALTDVPRAPEALVCMGIDEVLAAALGEEPATCKPTPTPTPTASPIPTASPTPGPTATPAGPTPVPTPSPGAGGCQPRLFGPCQLAPFTGCCNAQHHCAFIAGEEPPGYCIADPPSTTATPAPTATPVPSVSAPTPTGSATTPTPSPTPAPTASPGGGTPSPSPTGSPGEPTATPTASPVAGCSTATVTITTSYQAQGAPDFVAGVTTMLHYPGARLEIPGTGNQSTVLARVTNLSGVTALFSAGDQDTDHDGTDDLVSVGLISTGTAIPPGSFARVVFDCVAGEPAPVAADFSCTPDISSLFGNAVEATCTVAVATAS